MATLVAGTGLVAVLGVAAAAQAGWGVFGYPVFRQAGTFRPVPAGRLAAGLAWPGWRAGQQPAAVWRLSLALCLLWALGSELAQGLFTATRSAEAGDALADMLGAVAGIHLAYRAIAWRRPRV